MSIKKIGILGSGQVAQTLGAGFLKHGFQVMLGSSDPGKLTKWKDEQGTLAGVGSFNDAASYGELLVLAVKGTVAEKVLLEIDSGSLSGKTIIDATNPIADAPPQNGVLQFFTSLNQSLMEQLQQVFAHTHFVKAFNSVGNAIMVNPTFKEGKPTMFICGNNDQAKETTKMILDKFGWETEDLGKAEAARAIEPLCILWCIPGFLSNRWSHAFKLLK
jgi:8-hydroxy-5-deazaflavin:NADPH oxidoreductase